jgi:hypothetical protein
VIFKKEFYVDYFQRIIFVLAISREFVADNFQRILCWRFPKNLLLAIFKEFVVDNFQRI